MMVAVRLQPTEAGLRSATIRRVATLEPCFAPALTIMEHEKYAPMKILYLHGWHSTPGGIKPTYLAQRGHEVLNPALPDDDFDAAVHIAQAEFDEHRPDVVVGSSRGGAVAMNIASSDTRLVLLCPAWKRWGTATTVKPGTVILHSRADEVVPFSDSVELRGTADCPSRR